MNKERSHKFCSGFLKVIAVALSLILIAGALPARAASNEMVVKTKKQLVKAMESNSAATIIFRTNRKTKFIIPEITSSANKKLVMEAPNARTFNKATFKTITLNGSEYFNERGDDNSLYVKGDGVKLTVSKGIEAKKVSITATDVIIKVASNGNVGDIVCNKKEADITIAVAKNAEANITVKKKTELTVTGDKTSEISVVSRAADTKINTSVPMEIVAEKDTDIVMKKGSEGSTVTNGKDADVNISGDAAGSATVKGPSGEVIKEPENDPDGDPSKDSDGDPSKDPSEDPPAEPENGETVPEPTLPIIITPPALGNSYKVTVVLNETNGSIRVSSTNGTVGSQFFISVSDTVTFKFSPHPGYKPSIDYTGGGRAAEVIKQTDYVWTITKITADITIHAGFELMTATDAITLKAGNVTQVTQGTVTGKAFELKLDSTKYATVTSVGGNIDVELTTEGAAKASDVITIDFSEFATVDSGDWDLIYNSPAIIMHIADSFTNLGPVYFPAGKLPTWIIPEVVHWHISEKP